MRFRFATVIAAAAVTAVLVIAGQGEAQIKKGKTRPLQTKHLMSRSIGPNCSALGKVVNGTAPADDKGWDDAVALASLLNEGGHSLMADGRCPDATWAGAAKTLQDCSSVVVQKLEAKDLSGAKEAFTAMVGSCKSCHTAHKK